jgi:large subunit ribosomal protein L19e
MNLKTKKQLAAKTLGVGKRRIIFNPNSLADIKEAITKQDIKTLYDEGIIMIKPEKGRRKIKKRKTKKGFGKIKIKIKKRKQTYVKLTRKLRAYLKELKNAGHINKEIYHGLRTKIKMRNFKSKAHLKEYADSLAKEKLESKPANTPKKDVKKIKRTKKTKVTDYKEIKIK